jgi:hypothetical protein
MMCTYCLVDMFLIDLHIHLLLDIFFIEARVCVKAVSTVHRTIFLFHTVRTPSSYVISVTLSL